MTSLILDVTGAAGCSFPLALTDTISFPDVHQPGRARCDSEP